MQRRKWFWNLALVGLLLFGGVISAWQGNVRAAEDRSPAQDNVVISEFRSRGPTIGNEQADEFVELYNPTPNSIDIGGWLIRSVSSTGGLTTRATIPPGTWLDSGKHYLAATTVSGLSGDITMSAGISDSGGVALVNGVIVVDQVGMSIDAAEGTPLDPLSGIVDQSYERNPGNSIGNCYDTDNNRSDFSYTVPSNPQNLSNPAVSCASPTSTPTVTNTSTSTNTSTPSSTHTNTLSPSYTLSPTNTSTPSDTATPTDTGTPTGSPTPTGTSTATRTSTPTPNAANHIVISEFRFLGPNGADDEFVEVYNPTGGEINIGGWVIKRFSSCGTTVYNLVTIDSGVSLKPGEHYLLASSSNSSITNADQTFSPGIAADGGVGIFTSSSSTTAVDKVGLCAQTEYEGTPLPALSGNLSQSYEREAGGSTSCFDTDNNLNDFILLAPSNPQNQASPVVVCAGIATFTPSNTGSPTRTPTLTRTRTSTRTASRTPTPYPGVVVINELLPRPRSDWNGDGVVNTSDEYIELINIGTQSTNLHGWELDDGDTVYTLPEIILLPREIVRFNRSDTDLTLSDGGDTIRLTKPDGNIADAFTYSIVGAPDQTWCRLPDGTGGWGFVCFPTPGRLNERIEGRPASGSVLEMCNLPNLVPEAIVSAECDTYWQELVNRSPLPEFWLSPRWKLPVFVE